jgi:hypothetical protein
VDSRGWVVGLAIAAAALAALLVADLAIEPEPPATTRIVPDWDARAVRSIRFERPGAPAVVIEREAPVPPGSPAEEGWSLHLPASGAASFPVDPAALRELFGTIEMLAAIRRDPGGVPSPRITLVIEPRRGPIIRLELAGDVAGPTDRVWLARAGQGGRFLVDGYAARALDAADSLRERRPLRGRLDRVTRIEVAAGDRAAVLVGPDWHVELPGGTARAAPERVRDLLDWAGRLRIDEFTRAGEGPPTAQLIFTTRAGQSTIAYLAGACESAEPGDRPGAAPAETPRDQPGEAPAETPADPPRDMLGHAPRRTPGEAPADTPVGRGCLPMRADMAALSQAETWVDRDLVGAPVDRVARLRLERGGRAIEVARADSPEALRAWLTAWRSAAAGPLVPAERWTAFATVELEIDGDRREQIAIGRAGDRLAVRRGDDPVALLLQPSAAVLLDPSPHRFRSLDLLTADPSALRAATARRGARVIEAIERGEMLEDWRAAAPGSATGAPSGSAGSPSGSAATSPMPAAIDSLRQAVGFLRAERFAAASAGPGHGLSPPRRTVELVFDPPPGGAELERHTVELGASVGDGCYARLDRDPAVFELSAARCAGLFGPWTQRSPTQRAP